MYVKCTLVPALSRISILPQWKFFCLLCISKTKQDPVEKNTGHCFNTVTKQNHRVFLTKFTQCSLTQNTQCPFSTTPFIWNTCTVTCMLIILITIINSKKRQTSFGRNSVWSCKQVILEDPFLKQKKRNKQIRNTRARK